MDTTDARLNGWWVFAAILLIISGSLNLIWGIAAIGNSSFFVGNAHYVLGSLRNWGWVTVILGGLELLAGFSLFSGGGFGRWMGILAATLTSISALLTIPAYPFWSLCVFSVAIIIIYELAKGPDAHEIA